MNTSQLSEQLTSEVKQIIEQVEQHFLPLDREKLNWKENPDRWSILECLEHLNRYSRYYNPILERKVLDQTSGSYEYKSRWMGRVFINMMDPKNSKKQKTFKHLNPVGSSLDKNVISEFIMHQAKLIQILEHLPQVNPNITTVPVEFMKLLKLSIGDALSFVITHEKRHLQQAKNVLQKQNFQHVDLVV